MKLRNFLVYCLAWLVSACASSPPWLPPEIKSKQPLYPAVVTALSEGAQGIAKIDIYNDKYISNWSVGHLDLILPLRFRIKVTKMDGRLHIDLFYFQSRASDGPWSDHSIFVTFDREGFKRYIGNRIMEIMNDPKEYEHKKICG